MCRSLETNDVLASVKLPAWHANERGAAGPMGRAGRLLRPGMLRGRGARIAILWAWHSRHIAPIAMPILRLRSD
jgi:hypothetical protein